MKIRILSWARQTGKTIEVKKFLDENPASIAITLNVRQAKSIGKKAVSYRNGIEKIRGMGYTHYAIDEVDCIPHKDFLELMDYLTKTDTVKEVLIVGTPLIKYGEITNFQWLFERYPNSFTFKTAPKEIIESYGKTLSSKEYKTEILGAFDGVRT